MTHRTKINRKDNLPSHFSGAYAPNNGAKRQMKILPPSKPFIGSKFSIAKKKEAIVKKIRYVFVCATIDLKIHNEIIPDMIFATGPDRESSNSFLYEYIGNETPILAPNIFSVKPSIFIFKISAAIMCPDS